MDHCPIVQRMKAAYPIQKLQLKANEFADLEAELKEIAELLVKCCNDYTKNGKADGMKYLSKIDAVKTFLPEPESYRNLIEKNCKNPSCDPANPEFYQFKIVKVVNGTIRFKSLFSLEPVEESVEMFVVLQVGQRMVLILVSMARIALLQSRCHTALACCRVGLILVQLLCTISSRVMWTSHLVLLFLLTVETAESCYLIAAYDHLSCSRCLEIFEKTVLHYWNILDTFRSYGDGLIKPEDDIMFGDGESIADIGTIGLKLQTPLICNNFIGEDLLFTFSVLYFHLAVMDVVAFRNVQHSSVQNAPRYTYLEFCVYGLEGRPDSYMLAAALFCRGCFLSASGHKGPNQKRTKKLMAAEMDFLYILNMAKRDRICVSSMPWQRLIEKAYLANLVTQCRLLVRCATSSDVKHFRNSLDYLYSLAKWRSSPTRDCCSSSSRQFSALACLVFVYLTDHIPGAADVFEGSEKASVSLRRAECESLAYQLLEDESTVSFCLKVFCDLTKEKIFCENVLTDWPSQLRRCLHRLNILSLPIFAAVNSLFQRAGTTAANATSSAGADNTKIVSLCQSNWNDTKLTGCCNDSSKDGNNASISSSSDALFSPKSPLQIQRNSDNKDRSECFIFGKVQTSGNDFANESANGSYIKVNTRLKDSTSNKSDNHVLQDSLESSIHQFHFEETNIPRPTKLASTVDIASLKSETDALLTDVSMLHASDDELTFQSRSGQILEIVRTPRTKTTKQSYNPSLYNQKPNSADHAVFNENGTESLPKDSILNTSPHFKWTKSVKMITCKFIHTDTNNTHRRPKMVIESLKDVIEASPVTSQSPLPICDTATFSVHQDFSNSTTPVVSVAPINVTNLLDVEFDLLRHRKLIFPKINVFPSSQSVVLNNPNEEWVANFSPNGASPEEAEQTSCIESESVTSLEVGKESGVLLKGSLCARENECRVSIKRKSSAPQKGYKCAQEGVVKSNFRSVSQRIPQDTESWLVFLRQSHLLTMVEHRLDGIFFIDGTDDLLCWKNIIASDLQDLCRAVKESPDYRSNNSPDHLPVFAHRAYTTALHHLKRGSGLAEFHSLLMTLFDELNANPFASAARWA